MNYFVLNNRARTLLQAMTPKFGYGQYGEIIYYRTYSRMNPDQERWADTVIRVINGVFTLRKTHYTRNRIAWDEAYWQTYAERMAIVMFRMNWLPPGRGLWAMGSDLVYERGSMALYNCAWTEVGESWIEDLAWLMDTLMYGVGVGFGPKVHGLKLYGPSDNYKRYLIPDTREGWVESVKLLLIAFDPSHPDHDGTVPFFDYSLIRPEGAPIVSFGGYASGPEPLKALHEKLFNLCTDYKDGLIDEVCFKTDVGNLIGVCVVTGNVRRSAEIAIGEIDDPVFMGLKDYDRFPHRVGHGYMSNNSVYLRESKHFEQLDLIAQYNIEGKDVGYLNMKNVVHGRLGKYNDVVRLDTAAGLNPCGEIPLENKEVCNLAETLPTRCTNKEAWLKACEYATFYCSTVALWPTHQEETNKVINRNRRIGVSLVDFTGWKEEIGLSKVTRALRDGYSKVREVNKDLAAEAGVPESIRVTTVKPGGTVPKLPGKTSGASHPTFHYTLRRTCVQESHPLVPVLIEAGIPYEKSVYTEQTLVFEYPIEQGPAAPAREVSVWEQAMNVVLLQREWADNAVSNTIYFIPMWEQVNATVTKDGPWTTVNGHRFVGYDVWIDEGVKYKYEGGNVYRYNENHEEGQLADLLAHIAPLTKSISLLPHSSVGAFAQMPEEGITRAEYLERLDSIKNINWSEYKGSDGLDEKYCEGDKCVM